MLARLAASVLLIATVVLAALLVRDQHSSAILEQQVGPTRCFYDSRLNSVVMDVPFAAKTRGGVTWEVQAQVLDRRDPNRQPYVATRVVSMSTSGHTERTSVKLEIGMLRSEWLAGHNDCEISMRTVQRP